MKFLVLFQQPNASATIWFLYIVCLKNILTDLQIHPVPKSLPFGFCVPALNPFAWCWMWRGDTWGSFQCLSSPTSGGLRHQALLLMGILGDVWLLDTSSRKNSLSQRVEIKAPSNGKGIPMRHWEKLAVLSKKQNTTLLFQRNIADTASLWDLKVVFYPVTVSLYERGCLSLETRVHSSHTDLVHGRLAHVRRTKQHFK